MTTHKFPFWTAAKAQAPASITNGTKTYPFIVQSSNFWFVAEDPLANVAEDSAYLVFCEQLHDMVGIPHSTSHKALVRIEDIDATEDPAAIRAIADYLSSEGVPFSLAVIPRFADPLGAWGPPATIDLDESPELVSALNYAESKGGTIVMHGYTHQYGSVANPTNGVSGVDSEFYIQQLDGDGNIIDVSPVPEDSSAWAQGRVDASAAIFSDAGFSRPLFWETPHYLASEIDEQVFADNFGAVYQRFASSFFPYALNRTVYGSALVPENLGYISPGTISAQTIVNRADRNLAIRDGYASFFFHSEVNISYLQTAVSGIKAKGFTFVDARTAADTLAPAVTYSGPSGYLIHDSATVTATVIDPAFSAGLDASGITISVDGGVPIPGVLAGGSITCPLTGLAEGSHGVRVTAADNAGNSGYADGTFFVDSVAPSITGLTPGGWLDSNSVLISGDVSEAGSGLESGAVAVSIDGGAPTSCAVTGSRAECDVDGLDEGMHGYKLRATDRAGNIGEASGSFGVDTLAPYIGDLMPVGVVKGNATVLSAQFSDSAGVDAASVTVTLDSAALTDCAISATGFTCAVDDLDARRPLCGRVRR